MASSIVHHLASVEANQYHGINHSEAIAFCQVGPTGILPATDLLAHQNIPSSNQDLNQSVVACNDCKLDSHLTLELMPACAANSVHRLSHQ
jgi:hypothetical protein